MEIIAAIISFILLIGLILSPILILKKLNKSHFKYKFIVYLALGIIITSILMLVFAWWSYFSNRLLLSHYGYDFDAMNYQERFKQVSSNNLERVKSLEISNMGIGWPLKAIMSYIFYSPYLLLVYLVSYFFYSKENNSNT
jgi:hypothetical protein